MSGTSDNKVWMVAPPGKHSGELPLRALIPLMVVVLLPVVFVAQWAAHWRMDVVDDQMFGYYGWRILHGATVYLDVWDNKPPGIYWINALGFLIGGDSYAGVIALCAAAVVAWLVAFFVIANSIYFRGAAALATVLAGFFMTHGSFQCGANRTETFLIACELAAVAFYMRGFARDRWWKWYAAGLLCGGAFLFKQVGLAAWGSMGLHTIVLVGTRDLPWRDGLRRCVLLLVGLLTTVGVASGFLAWQGAFREAVFATFGFNAAYFVEGRSKWGGDWVNWFLLRQQVWPVLQLPLLMSLAALIHAVLWRLRPWLRPKRIEAQLDARPPVCPQFMFLFATWYLVAFYGAILSPHAFSHYIAPTIPPLMLMAGYLINVLRAERRLLHQFQQHAWVIAAFVAIGYFAAEGVKRDFEVASAIWVERVERGDKAEWEIVGEQVALATRPDDKIQCWSYMPGVYLVARRPNACRFTTTEKIGQVKAEADFIKRELYQKLMSEPPVLFVVRASDYNWLHGITPNGEDVDEPDRLGLWLDENYTRIADIAQANVYLYRRNDLMPAGD